MKQLTTAIIVLLLATTACMAEDVLSITDGGYEISGYIGEKPLSIRHDAFTVTGKGKYAKRVLGMANVRSIERQQQFGRDLDMVISAHFASRPLVVERPVYLDRPVYIDRPIPVPDYDYSDSIPPPPGYVDVDYWINSRRFFCRNGWLWYWDNNGYWRHY